MKKIVTQIGVGVMFSLLIFSCSQTAGGGAKYQAINRQKGILLVDQYTGEVFMMELVVEKGKGVVGSDWRKLGKPTNAK